MTNTRMITWLGVVLAGMCFCLPAAAQDKLPTAPGEYRLKYTAEFEGQKFTMAYLLVLPQDYTRDRVPRPALVFLHGAGEAGADHGGLFVHGPPMELRRDKAFGRSFPFILVAPQCPPRGERWDQPKMVKATLDLLDMLEKQVRIDRDRVYVTGLSMGGTGTWHLSIAAPGRFAAIAPISSGMARPDEAGEALAATAVWSITGGGDGGAVEANRKMLEKVKGGVVERRSSVLAGFGHDAWVPAYRSVAFYEWLLAQKRPDAKGLARLKEKPEADGGARSPLPSEPGLHVVNRRYGEGDAMQYLQVNVFVPRPLPGSAADRARPLLVHLHPASVVGAYDDGVTAQGPLAGFLGRPGERLRNTTRAVVLGPKLPLGAKWDDPALRNALAGLIDEATGALNIDEKRIVLSGYGPALPTAVDLASVKPERLAGLYLVTGEQAIERADALIEKLEKLQGAGVWLQAAESHKELLTKLKQSATKQRPAWRIAATPQAKVGEMADAFTAPTFWTWVLEQHRR